MLSQCYPMLSDCYIFAPYIIYYMKKQIKYISIIGVIAILVLQCMWFYNTYILIRTDLQEKVNICFNDTSEKELFQRLAQVKPPEGTRIDAGEISQDGNFESDNLNLQEAMIKFKAPVSTNVLSKLFSKEIKKHRIRTKFIVNKINPKTGKIIESSDLHLNDELSGAMCSQIIPIRKDHSEGIQLLIISPYKAIFDRMLLILISSIMMAIVVGCCIAYQIKIIIKQNKIAQLRLDLTNTLIHEMKTPLTTIIVGIRMLKSGNIDNQLEKKDKHFKICIDESNHLLKLTNRILTIAKIEQGKLELEKQLIDLNKLIQSLIDKFKVSAKKKVDFVSTIDNGATSVLANYDYLQEAISNLIDNSIKYSHEEVKIELHCLKEDNWLKIKVKDNGFGIEPRDQAKIFEKFERAAAIRRKNGAVGFGLGLNYVLKVIEAHNGKIDIESIKDEYSEFTICLPLLIEDL